jgi:hypothetical protein
MRFAGRGKMSANLFQRGPKEPSRYSNVYVLFDAAPNWITDHGANEMESILKKLA